MPTLRGDANSGFSIANHLLHRTGFSRSIVDSPARVPHKHSHYLAATLLSFWLLMYQTSAQSHDVAFGIVQTFSTPGMVERFRLSTTTGTKRESLLLWTPGSTYLHTVELPLQGTALGFQTYSLATPFDDVYASDFNNDGETDFLFVHTADRLLSLVYTINQDSLTVSTKIQLPIEPTKIVFGDVNNDKRIDLLVIDSRTPGILPYFGGGNGVFRKGAVISADNAVQDLSLVFLNNDFLSDAVFYDWVKSELHFSYGVGRGRFLDLTTLAVEGKAEALAILPLATKRFMDIVLQLPDELQVWEGDETGDFRNLISLPMAQQIVSFAIADIDADGNQDFAVLDNSGTLKIILAPLEVEASSTLDFSVGTDTRQILLSDFTGDERIDALVLRNNGRELWLYRNAREASVLTDSLQFATGKEPRGVWVGDITGNQRNDIVLVNRGSNSLSLYTTGEDEGIRGQIMVPLPDGPHQLSHHSTTDSTVNFIVTYPSTQSISFLSVRKENISTVNAFIPEVGELELLYANTTATGSAEFFCYNLASDTRSPSLVFYQQLEAQTFIERTFKLSIPDLLLGAGVGDVNKDGLVDIAYAYRNNEANRNELVLSLGDSSLSYKNKHQVLPLPEGTPRRSYMWLDDFGHNDTLDLLLVFPHTLKQALLAKGVAGGKFDVVERIPEEILLADRSQLQVLDLDKDGLLDIVVHNDANHQLGWYRGTTGKTFAGWSPLLTQHGMSHYAFGDLNADGILDLAVTMKIDGLLKVYDGRILVQNVGADLGR